MNKNGQALTSILFTLLPLLYTSNVYATHAEYSGTKTITVVPIQETDWSSSTWRYKQKADAHNNIGENSEQSANSFVRPATGVNTSEVAAQVTGASSISTVSGSVNSARGQPLTVTTTVKGSADADIGAPPPTKSWSHSDGYSFASAVTVKTDGHGHITAGIGRGLKISGSTEKNGTGSSLRDPIEFSATDLSTGETRAGVFFDSNVSIYDGNGELTWKNGILTISATGGSLLSGSFSIDMSSIYTLQKGSLNFEFKDNTVTTSTSSGVFEGLMPSVGQNAIGVFTTGQIGFDYDLGFGSNQIDLTLNIPDSGSADAVASAVPEPESYTLLIAGIFCLTFVLRRRIL